MRETRTFETQSAAKLTETRVDAETAAELLKADVAPLTAFVAVDDSRREIARQSKGGPGKSVARRRSRSTSRGARARSVSPTRAKESEENLNRARLLEATKVPSPLHEEKEKGSIGSDKATWANGYDRLLGRPAPYMRIPLVDAPPTEVTKLEHQPLGGLVPNSQHFSYGTASLE